MPNGDDLAEVPLSQQINKARKLLLTTLKDQLDDLVVTKLVEQEKGVPFIDFGDDPPQIVTIKKVINCLYHAEEGFKYYESVDKNSVLGKALGAKKYIQALIQIYKSIGMLDDASPEIRRVIADNYYLLEPIYTQSFKIIKESGWVSEFIEMDVTDKASKVIMQGMDLLGPDVNQWNNEHPLISAFTKISKLVELISSLQDKEMAEQDREKAIELIRSMLNDLDKNPFINKLNFTDLENSKAIQDLFSWFKNIEEDGFNFTKNSLKNYISWANHYLPSLILFTDQLEQQNYLKSGLLSTELCSQIERLSKQANQLLSVPNTFDVSERVISIESLQALREQQFNSIQVKSVQSLVAIENQQTAATEFFRILKTYKGESLEIIPESERVLLRKLYPKIQMALAHTDLNLENQLAAALNKVGPEKYEPKSKAWWQKAVGYVANYIVSAEIDKILGAESAIAQFMSRQIAAEEFKILIAEKSRDHLTPNKVKEEQLSLEKKASQRILLIKTELMKQPTPTEVVPREIVPVKPKNLVNLRGTLTTIQEMKLSGTVRETRTSLDTLIHRHLSEYQSFFTELPYRINEHDPDLVKQIKKVEMSLTALENALRDFEGLDLSYGVMIRLTYFIAIASAASQLKSSIEELSPNTQKTLAPILQQLLAYSSSFSAMSSMDSDLTALEQLKNGGKISTLPEQPKVTTTQKGEEPKKPPKDSEKVITETEERPKKEKSQDILNYANKIAQARMVLLQRLKTTLSAPLASQLHPQPTGEPFINIENDPPQIAAIKKLINSMYHAENALKTWDGIDTSTQLGKIAAAHQGVAALSQVYKSIALIAEASSEVQNLVRENDDLIKPVFLEANKLVKQYGWASQFNAFDVTKKIGSIIGQWTNSVQTEKEHTSAIIRLMTELPTLMNNLSSLMDPDVEKSVDRLRISERSINNINALYSLVIEENVSFGNVFKGINSIVGIIDLIRKIQKEGINLQETTIQFYQEWMQDRYPELMILLDKIETRHYLTPGLLSKPIALELNKINDKINEIIEAKQNSRLKPIPLSFDMGKIRKKELAIMKKEHLLGLFQIESQQRAAIDFFGVLKRNRGKAISEISAEELAQLRLAFVTIQSAMASTNLDLTNEFTVLLNLLETSKLGKTESKITIDSLMKLEPLVDTYLKNSRKSYELKIDVINNAIEDVKSQSFDLQFDTSEDINILQLRKQFIEDESKKPIVGPGELKEVSASSLDSVRGNIAYIQELNVSSKVADLREDFSVITKEYFSVQLQEYLKKAPDEQVHVIHKNDPLMVRQIKAVENGLYSLEMAFHHFEQMNKSDSLVSQTKALLEIVDNARQLKVAMESMTPELIERYGPLVSAVVDFGKTIQSFDYNKEDWADLKLVLWNAHDTLLKRNTPRKEYIQKAFHDAGVREDIVHVDPNEAAGKKAAKLGIKYAHLASPELERARAYLNSKYKKVFGEQPEVVRAYTREELANKELMQDEVIRMKEILDNYYGLNITTGRVLLDLLKQIQRVGAQTAEIANMINVLVKDDFSQIKEDSYKELIVRLSQEEDYLCLKPGTLINPAMAALNQFFLSVALELDMPFSKKLALIDEERYINIILNETQHEIKELEQKLNKDPSNPEISLNISVRKDKVAFLKQQVELLKEQDIEKTKSALLDVQFEVILRDHLFKTTIKEPIIQEYEKLVRAHYTKNKAQFLSVDECSAAVVKSLEQFQKNNIANYLLVSEAYDRLHKFSLKLPEKNKDLQDHIERINNILINKEIPIEKRALKAKSLPHDAHFIQKLRAADTGTSFLKKFKQFLVIITSSVVESIKTGGNLVSIYRQKLMEQSIKNIEKTIRFKEALVTRTTLTENILLEEIKEFARDHFQSLITKENQTQIKAAFEDYYHTKNTELSAKTKDLLLSLNIPKEKIQEFDAYLSNKYGPQYSQNAPFHKLVHDKLSASTDESDFTSRCHATKLDEFTGLYQLINQDITEQSRTRLGFFKQQLTPVNEASLQQEILTQNSNSLRNK
ncbi:protein SdhB [Legionella sainthelensi]|uniref:SdhB n=1 Tax=Legionella sainthelensi TaxID=28087 RepID=UPI000F6BDC22|nr:SdhB [Legionella sainthelensi]VEB37326.1 protein SdhB [Legionella sainthelensi]